MPVSFAHNTNFWTLELSRDEAALDDKAHVLANFCHLAMTKFWVSRHDRTFAGPRGMQGSRQDKVASVVINWLTTPQNEDNATLAAIACRKFVHMFELGGVDLVRALRMFFVACVMPSQGRRMCRLLWAFAGAFYQQNGGDVSDSPRDLGKASTDSSAAEHGPLRQQTGSGWWGSHDAVYLLIMSLVLLNGDAHNPQVKKKMQKEDWIHNTKLSLKQALPIPWTLTEDTLSRMYDDVTRAALLPLPTGRRVPVTVAGPGSNVAASSMAMLSSFLWPTGGEWGRHLSGLSSWFSKR